ncbi:MAG: mechanosensitive ion channel [Muribaculaceae bacterium]|nr:mechanosensitive ion channel [Muribaculaceae bacterium]
MLQTDNLTVEQLKDSTQSAKSAFESLKGLSFDDAISQIANSLVNFSFKLLTAILVFYAGKYVINKLYKVINKIMVSRKIDPSLTTFILSLVKMVLFFILIVTIIGILGLETSSFLALFASAGVAIGMALSGTLQNFAGGVLILLLKPYKVGDYIEASGFSGTVKAIQIFHTVINTPDNKTIIIPNGGLSTGSINNYSSENYRRVDWSVSLSYDTDYNAASAAIKKLLLQDERVVVQYIEDDVVRRLNAGHQDDSKSEEEKSIDKENEESGIPEAPKNFFSRLFESRHNKARRLQQKIKDKVSLGGNDIQKVDRAPFVGLSEMADSSINLTVRAWTHSSNYWPLYFQMNEVFFTELPKLGFSFPYPQLDVHIQQSSQ